MGFNNSNKQHHRRQQAAWAQQQEKKRKRRNRMSGINIHDSDNLEIDGDMIGGDKVTEIIAHYQRDEKNGCLLFIERAFTFTFTFGIIGGIAIAIGAGGGGAGGVIIVVGGIIAFVIAFLNTAQISRYRD